VKPSNPSRLFNRELSWLFFNTRVLEEAENTDVPLLERLRFLSISASNLDEFHMVRVAGLRSQLSAGILTPGAAGLMPAQQLTKIHRRSMKIVERQNKCWKSLRKELAKVKINVLQIGDLADDQSTILRELFDTQILPLLTPLSIDPTHPFPFFPNLGFGVVLYLEAKGRDPLYAVLPVPLNVPRFIEISNGKKIKDYIAIEDVLMCFSILPPISFRISRSPNPAFSGLRVIAG